jgi:pimeloyl-ACP methyl ester carboxylesterase
MRAITRSPRYLAFLRGAAIAIDYAARNPDRVTHLILWGGFARGRRMRGNAENRAESEAFVTLMRQGWGKETSPFRDMFAALYLPEASPEQIRWWTEIQQTGTSPDNAVLMREAIDDIDVSHLLKKIRMPTLVLHSERELVSPVSEARFMAARIPNARFVSLDSANHLVMEQEDAWKRALHEVQTFLSC